MANSTPSQRDRVSCVEVRIEAVYAPRPEVDMDARHSPSFQMRSEAEALNRRGRPQAFQWPFTHARLQSSTAISATLLLLREGQASIEMTLSSLALGSGAWLLRIGEVEAHEVALRLPSLPLVCDHRDNRLRLSAGQSELHFDLASLAMRLCRAERTLLASPGEEISVGGSAQAHGFFAHEGGYGLSVGLHHGERLYGGGEQFGFLDRRGSCLQLLNRDALGVGADAAYHNLPYFWSNRSFGMALLSPGPSVFDLQSRHDVVSWYGSGRGFLFLLQPAASPAAAVADFRRAIQTVGSVPEWSHELWLSRCYYPDAREVDAVLAEAHSVGIDKGVVNLDARAWMRADTRTDFVWDEARFPPAQEYIPSLRARGFEVCLWENPYVSSKAEIYAEGVTRGFFAKDDRGAAYPLVWVPQGLEGFPQPPVAGLVDFTFPEARAWWKDFHRPYIRAGVRCFKTDFGEEIPPDARFHDGSSGWQLRNVYADLYNQCVAEVLREECGDEGIVWARSGWFHAASTPVKWAGDSQTSYRALRATLRAGLNQAVAGALFWSHDIGGFYGAQPDAELFLRWAQLGLWSSHARFHGTGVREPWRFGAELWSRLSPSIVARRKARPYFLHSYRWCVHEATSFLRPLWMVCPEEPACVDIDDQFFAGPDVLVAPFLDAEGGRTLYLPEGEWIDAAEGGGRLRGGRFLHLERRLATPVFVRADSPWQGCLIAAS